MTHARTGGVVVAVHALLLAVAWQAGLRVGDEGHETAPLQVNLLASHSVSPSPRHVLAAPTAPALAAIPAIAALPAPPIAVAAMAAPTAAPEPPARAAEPVAPVTVAATPEPVAAPPVAPPVPIEPPLTQARADHQRCPSAPHPVALRERGIEGVVHLRVRVSAEGLPSEVNVASGSGWTLMDQAALAQVRGCRFLPARRGSEAVESWVEFPVRFVLKG